MSGNSFFSFNSPYYNPIKILSTQSNDSFKIIFISEFCEVFLAIIIVF